MANVPPQAAKAPHQEFIKVDTTNILFICGGAFAGLKIIESRINKRLSVYGRHQEKGRKGTGENPIPYTDPRSYEIRNNSGAVRKTSDNLFSRRVDKGGPDKILTELKNSLTQQYKALLAYDNVELSLPVTLWKR